MESSGKVASIEEKVVDATLFDEGALQEEMSLPMKGVWRMARIFS
jgi:hypothetical protein